MHTYNMKLAEELFDIGRLSELVSDGVLTPDGGGTPGGYSSEASELRIPPGVPPKFLVIGAFGRQIQLKMVGGDETCFLYDSCGNGLIRIRVFND